MNSTVGAPPVSEAEFTKIQELLYELTVGEVMTTRLISVTPGEGMARAKSLMRNHRISGLPVTDGAKLVGILSVEDLVRWLERGGETATIQDWMTKSVHTVRKGQPAIQAVATFGQTRVGRLPVLDEEGALVGIVTPGDIIGRVLRVMDRRYRANERRSQEQALDLRETLSGRGVLRLRYDVAAADFDRAGTAATGIKRLLGRLGVDPELTRRVSIAAYEAEMNLAIHTVRGGQLSMEMSPEQLIIEASDEAPGIADLDQAMTEGFSTAPDWIRALGFGAGMGLKNMKRCGDDFSIQSCVDEGTVVRVTFNLSPAPETGFGKASSTARSARES